MAPVQSNKTKNSETVITGLGVGQVKNKTVLFYSTKKDQPFGIALSDKKGLNFRPIKEKLDFPFQWWLKKQPDTSDYRLTSTKKGHFLVYLEKTNDHYQLKYRYSKNLIKWSTGKKIDSFSETGKIIAADKNNKLLFFGRKKIDFSLFKRLSQEPVDVKTIYRPKEEILGKTNLKICQTFTVNDGILILLYRYTDPKIWQDYSWQLVMVDKNQPDDLIWTRNVPIKADVPNPENQPINPIGAVKLDDQLISYWQIGKGKIFGLSQAFFKLEKRSQTPIPFPYLTKLKRHDKNPILKPKPENEWESKLVFNPAAVLTDEKVHLIYRAVGDKDISVLGYALTKDGLKIDFRLDRPVYTPRTNFEINYQTPKVAYNYISGWGCGGCEDPKLTKIGDTIYMVYTAWNGINPPGVALTSISEKDFINQNWNWAEPIMISPPGEIHKNWTIFPEKINKKYAILHSLSPRILVDYVDNLEFKTGDYIRSFYSPSGRKNHWDNWIRGAGPPPIKTDDGWLVLYHAMDKYDPGRYKVGGMVLDHKDPTKILYRSDTPLLEPDMGYENEGFKSGVVYTCGAVVKKNRLFVYYGGADTVSCVAHTKLNQLLTDFKNQNQTQMLKTMMYN